MSKIIVEEKNNNAIIEMEGTQIELLADLTAICRAMAKEGIKEDVIKYAVNLAFEDKKENTELEEKFKKELDKTLENLIEIFGKMQNSNEG